MPMRRLKQLVSIDQHLEEPRSWRRHSLNKKRPIKVQVPCLTTRLGHQQATVAGCSVQGSVFGSTGWIVAGADRVA